MGRLFVLYHILVIFFLSYKRVFFCVSTTFNKFYIYFDIQEEIQRENKKNTE